MTPVLFDARGRLNKILRLLKTLHIDGLLLNSEANASYAAGFRTPDSYLLVSDKGLTLVTDFRYAADFQKKAPSFLKIIEYKGTMFKTIVNTIKQLSLKSVGFESRHLSFAECQALHALCPKSIQFIPLKTTLESLREIKEPSEIKNIKKALEITQKAFEFVKKILKGGVPELHVAAELERFIRLEGAKACAFNIIVASGPNSSYPHAEITRRRLSSGEPVVIDMGVDYNGYKCDLTRTFFLGKIKPSVRKVVNVVRQAQRHAIKLIRPGISIKEIDLAARNYIAQKGFGKFFGHSLGHGVGLEVHEAPAVNRKNKNRLKSGMVFTIEPGIYLKDEFGIRLEEMVLVTDKGVEVLSGNYCD